MAQNKMLRLLDNSKLKDRRSTKHKLEKLDLLSVNQTVAQIKLVEVWMAMNDPEDPVEMRTMKQQTEKVISFWSLLLLVG